MRIKVAAAWITVVGCVGGAPAGAQDLGPQFMKFGDGIYAYVGKNFKSNTGGSSPWPGRRSRTGWC